MDSPSMTASANALAGEDFRVARFEFDYMAARRTGVGRMPPPRAEKLNRQYIAAVDALGRQRELVIGGKSMGGRVASMVADTLFESGRIRAFFASVILSIRPASRINCAPATLSI